MLRSLALVVGHVGQVKRTSWPAMLGKDVREVSGKEITSLEAEHKPFQAANGEG